MRLARATKHSHIVAFFTHVVISLSTCRLVYSKRAIEENLVMPWDAERIIVC